MTLYKCEVVNTLEVEHNRVRNSVKKSLSECKDFVIVTVNEYLVFLNAVLLLCASRTFFVSSFLRGKNAFNRQKNGKTTKNIILLTKILYQTKRRRYIKKIWKEAEPKVQHTARRPMIKNLTRVE